MSSMKFYAQGIEDATVTATSSDSLYPVTNLQLRSRRNYWKSASYGDQYITFNFATSKTFDFIYIDKNNFSDLANSDIQSITLQKYNGGAWTNVSTISLASNNPVITTFSPFTEATGDVRLFINDNGSNAVYPQINFILMGEMISDERFFPDFGATNINKNLGLVVHEAINGNKSAVRITQVESSKVRGKFDRTFKILTDAQFNELNRIYTDTSEMLYPFALSDYDDTLRFVRINTESYLEQMRYNIRNSTTLTFMEEI